MSDPITMSEPPSSPHVDALTAVQVEKARLEIAQLRGEGAWDVRLGRYIPLLAAVISVAGFLFGVFQFLGQQRTEAAHRTEELGRQSEAREMEYRRPYWERQLALYFAASEAAATIATSADGGKVTVATDDFWKLYWGPLAVVEDAGLEKPDPIVEAAMVRFGDALAEAPQDRTKLKRLSLDLAHEVRKSIGKSWNVKLADLSQSAKR